MKIPRIVRVVTICDEVFCKLRVSVDGMVTSKKVLSYYSRRIETRIDVVVEILKFQISVYFNLCLDEEFIESW